MWTGGRKCSPATTKWRLQAEVNVLLRVQADDEGRYVQNLGGEEEVVNLDSLQTSLTLFMTVAGLQEKFVMIHDIDFPLVINHVIKDVLTSILILYTCFLTRMCLCLIKTLAWWMDLASPSLNT